MRKLFSALLVATSAVPASSAIINYTLQNVAFDDGARATGTFAWDDATSKFTSIDVSTTAGVIGAAHYIDPATSNFVSPDYFSTPSVIIANAGIGSYLNLRFDTALDTAGLHMLILGSPSSGSWECDNCGVARLVVSGAVTSEDVPEPAMLGLFGLGAIGLGLSRRRES